MWKTEGTGDEEEKGRVDEEVDEDYTMKSL